MQKVLQRTERAQRVAVRRAKKFEGHRLRGEAWNRDRSRKQIMEAMEERIRQERINRKEDWERGPLAPRRDVGDRAKTYGSIHMYDMTLPDREPEKRPEWYHITEGDRVVIMRGRDRGRIGRVSELNKAKVMVRVKNLNMIDVELSQWMLDTHAPEEQNIQATPQLISLDDVKLVYPLPDPQTGTPRDVVIERLECINRKFDKHKREWDDGDRVIPGMDMIIPWPEKAEPRYEDNEDDTLRLSAEERTIRPFLLHAPMPLSVIDELRGKYSRFRTRHEREYRLKKELEDANKSERKKLVKAMQTPLQELMELRAKRNKAEEKDLTTEQLARIGEVIAREKEEATKAVKTME